MKAFATVSSFPAQKSLRTQEFRQNNTPQECIIFVKHHNLSCAVPNMHIMVSVF